MHQENVFLHFSSVVLTIGLILARSGSIVRDRERISTLIRAA